MNLNNNENDLNSKYQSINSWLDNEDSKYSEKNDLKIEKEKKENNDNLKINENSKKDILFNIDKLIEENDKKDLTLLLNKNNNNKINGNYNDNFNNIKAKNTNDILCLTLELNELKKTNIIMKETIQNLKNEISENELKYKESLSNELDKQKYEYEKEIQNLKYLITNLMTEKKELNKRISNLGEQMEEIEGKYRKKINELKEKNELDNKNNIKAWHQVEKNRRKKWEEGKIKEIKEMTIKNLEPELDKILKDHKKELLNQEQNLKDDFRKQKEKLISEYEDKIERMKKNFIKEKEEIQEKERKEYIKRLREQNIRLEDQHCNEQKKWYVNLQEEIKRLEELRNKDKMNYENDLSNLVNKYNNLLEEKENYINDIKLKEEEKNMDKDSVNYKTEEKKEEE